MAESAAHLQLKQLAVEWAVQQGYQTVAAEVRVPLSNFRADAVACRFERPAQQGLQLTRTVIFECKQSRADLLNDIHDQKTTEDRLKVALERQRELTEKIGRHYPHIRQGNDLFPEFQSIDPSSIRHEGYTKLEKEIQTLKNRLYQHTQFDKISRYACADLCFLVVAPGILNAHEIPDKWGVLEADESMKKLEATLLPTHLNADPSTRLELLKSIASKAMPRTEPAT